MHCTTVNLALENGQKLPIRLCIARSNGDWIATAEATILGRPVRLTATASEALIRGAMARLGQPVATGGFFDDLGKKIARFARSKAVGSVLQSIASVAKNPLMQKLASVYPPMAIAMDHIAKGAEAASSAHSLIARARGGDQLAVASIAKITKAAQGGNAAGRLMHNVLVAVNKSEKIAPAARVASSAFQFPGFAAFANRNDIPVSAGAALSNEDDDDLTKLARTIRASL